MNLSFRSNTNTIPVSCFPLYFVYIDINSIFVLLLFIWFDLIRWKYYMPHDTNQCDLEFALKCRGKRRLFVRLRRLELLAIRLAWFLYAVVYTNFEMYSILRCDNFFLHFGQISFFLICFRRNKCLYFSCFFSL